MNAIVSPSARFAIDGEGTLWGSSPSVGYNFWMRYLDVYDEVHLLVRAKPVKSPPEGAILASGAGVRALPLPYYHGPVQYVKQYWRIQATIRYHVRNAYAIQMRLPLMPASTIISALPAGKPYGVEVVGDPHDVFAPGAVRHPLRPFFRWWFARNLRRQCAGACAAAYVTAQALQRRYPPAPDAFSTSYSDVQLPDDTFVAAPRVFQAAPSPARLVMVGTLEQMYKAPDVLIDAVVRCVERRLDVHLTLVGDGKHRPELEARAAAAGLGERVRFTGSLSAGAAVRAALDQADVFVLPSRQEGLPRALIEAMARGLPCIGSAVGGIPELLPPEDLVPPGDALALADKIADMVTNPERLTRSAARNLEAARAYHEDILRARRIEFYKYVRDATAAWLKAAQR